MIAPLRGNVIQKKFTTMQSVNELREMEKLATEMGLPVPLKVLEHSHKQMKALRFSLDDPQLLKEHLLTMFTETMKSINMDENTFREQLVISFNYLYGFLEEISKEELN
jgi:predicted ATP-grasp superfamily ATP-dependent carboligase